MDELLMKNMPNLGSMTPFKRLNHQQHCGQGWGGLTICCMQQCQPLSEGKNPGVVFVSHGILLLLLTSHTFVVTVSAV